MRNLSVPSMRSALVAAVLAGMLFVRQPSALTLRAGPSRLGTNGSVFWQEAGDGLLFDPLHQKSITYRDKEVSIALVTGAELAITVRRYDRDAVRIDLPREMAQVNEIRRAAGNRAVVIGMVNGDVWQVVVIDIALLRASDTFLAYMPSVSPDGHYLAFIKFFPAHFVEGPDDHYMLYDFALSASQNRPLGISIFDMADVGTGVYPTGVGNKEGDNTGIPDTSAHHAATERFFWSRDSTKYVFADTSVTGLSLVMVSIEAEHHASASVANISTQEVCPGAQKAACQVYLKEAAFEGEPLNTITALFAGRGTEASGTALRLGYQRFKPA